MQCHAPWPTLSRTRAGLQVRQMPGRRAFGTSGSQGSLGKDPGSIEGNDGAALSPFDGCRVLGRGLQEATVVGMLGVRPLRRIRSPDAHSLGSIGPARPGRGLRSRGRVQDLPERSDLRELVMPGTASRVAGRRPPSRRACRARLPSVRAVRPHHRTGVMDGRVCAGATWDGVPDRGQP